MIKGGLCGSKHLLSVGFDFAENPVDAWVEHDYRPELWAEMLRSTQKDWKLI